MKGACYNCDFVGEFDWQWNISAVAEEDQFCLVTAEADPSFFNDDKYVCIEVYHCPKCEASQ